LSQGENVRLDAGAYVWKGKGWGVKSGQRSGGEIATARLRLASR